MWPSRLPLPGNGATAPLSGAGPALLPRFSTPFAASDCHGSLFGGAPLPALPAPSLGSGRVLAGRWARLGPHHPPDENALPAWCPVRRRCARPLRRPLRRPPSATGTRRARGRRVRVTSAVRPRITRDWQRSGCVAGHLRSCRSTCLSAMAPATSRGGAAAVVGKRRSRCTGDEAHVRTRCPPPGATCAPGTRGRCGRRSSRGPCDCLGFFAPRGARCRPMSPRPCVMLRPGCVFGMAICYRAPRSRGALHRCPALPGGGLRGRSTRRPTCGQIASSQRSRTWPWDGEALPLLMPAPGRRSRTRSVLCGSVSTRVFSNSCATHGRLTAAQSWRRLRLRSQSSSAFLKRSSACAGRTATASAGRPCALGTRGSRLSWPRTSHCRRAGGSSTWGVKSYICPDDVAISNPSLNVIFRLFLV